MITLLNGHSVFRLSFPIFVKGREGTVPVAQAKFEEEAEEVVQTLMNNIKLINIPADILIQEGPSVINAFTI